MGEPDISVTVEHDPEAAQLIISLDGGEMVAALVIDHPALARFDPFGLSAAPGLNYLVGEIVQLCFGPVKPTGLTSVTAPASAENPDAPC